MSETRNSDYKLPKIIFISVVRDFKMYDRLVRKNVYNSGADFIAFDNRNENIGIASRYNFFLDGYDFAEPAWFVFCHEDWEAKESIASKLNSLSTGILYGPIGAKSIVTEKKIYRYSVGECWQSDRNGENLKKEKGLLKKGIVDTFDCQCLIVHSTLIGKYSLRFDPSFSFDLYVEDFCINSFEKYGIVSKVLPMKCRHWSHGKLTDRFYSSKSYLEGKYSGIYTTTAGGAMIGNTGTKKVISFKHSIFNHPEKYWIMLTIKRK